MKITQKQFNDLVDHALRDISYESGGSYGDGTHFNSKAAAQTRNTLFKIAAALDLQFNPER